MSNAQDCNFLCVSPFSLVLHKKTVHEDRRDHACETCGMQFGHKSSLVYHRLTHLEDKDRDKFPCPIQGCDFVATTAVGLKGHVTGTKHLGIKSEK